MKIILGLSTGCFFKWKLDIYGKIKQVIESRANGLEIAFFYPEDVFSFEVRRLDIKKILAFDYVSVHLPYLKVLFKNNDLITQKIVKKCLGLKKVLGVKNFIIHPNVVKAYSSLSVLAPLYENLGSPHKFGSSLEDLKQIKRMTNPQFLFDIAHLYKQKHNFSQLNQYLNLMKDKIGEIHFSGFKDKNEHSAIYNAENKEEALSILKRLQNFPLISEGQLPPDNFFLKKELREIKKSLDIKN